MVRVFDTYDDFKEYASRRFVPVWGGAAKGQWLAFYKYGGFEFMTQRQVVRALGLLGPHAPPGFIKRFTKDWTLPTLNLDIVQKDALDLHDGIMAVALETGWCVCDEHVGLYKLFSSICTRQHEFQRWCVKESNVLSAKKVRVCDDVLFGGSRRDVVRVPVCALFGIYKWFLERIGEPQLLGGCKSFNHFKEKMHVFMRKLHRCSRGGKPIRMHHQLIWCYFVDVRLLHETLCKHAYFDEAAAARGDIWCVYE